MRPQSKDLQKMSTGRRRCRSTGSVRHCTPYDEYYEDMGKIDRSKLARRRYVDVYVEQHSNNHTLLGDGGTKGCG